MAEMSGYDGKNVSSSQDTFDYVIVGAGSAGCPRCAGVDNLRVIDASVMPSIVGGNTNATAS
jgi:choline dehydrogenase-like flavoprotein